MSSRAKKLIASSIITIVVMYFIQDITALPAPSINAPASDTAKEGSISQVAKELSVKPGSSQLSLVTPIQAGHIDLKASLTGPKSNSAEKLKRGLTNFMNQLNPAAFFVPNSPATMDNLMPSGAKQKAQSSAEPAAIVNGDSTVDVLIKGPNRLSQTRPIGGPLRWG